MRKYLRAQIFTYSVKFRVIRPLQGCPKNNRKYETPLSIELIPSPDDCSENEANARDLEVEYDIDFTCCVGSLIYLGMTHTDISYAVNKLAKYTQKPGRNHFEVLLHLLRYL